MNNSTTKSLSWLIALLGVWEVISPWVLGFANQPAAMIISVAAGVLLIIFGLTAALVRTAAPAMVLNWLNALLGIWLIIVPFILGFAAVTYAGEVSSIIVGAAVLVLGIWAAVAASRGTRAEMVEMSQDMGQMRASIPVTGSLDHDIRNNVMDRLVQDPRVDATMIDVLVNNGEVTLRGMVHNADEKRLAESDAEAVAGVRTVKDDLTTSM